MPRAQEKTVYQFSELNDRAKDKARDWYRQFANDSFNDFSAETVIEDAARLADLFGLNIRTRTAKLMGGGTRQEPEVYYSGFSSQGDGASYSGRYGYKAGSVKALEAEAPSSWEGKPDTGNTEINRIARELAEVQRRNFYQVQAIIDGRSHRGFTLEIDVERSDSKPITEADIDTVKECLRDFANWIYRQLEREYEYQNSDEVIDENIGANEYEFDEEGRRA